MDQRPPMGGVERWMRRRELRRLLATLDGLAAHDRRHGTGPREALVALRAEVADAIADDALTQDRLNAISHAFPSGHGIDPRDERDHPPEVLERARIGQRGEEQALALRVVRWWSRTGHRPTA